jgi:hypothetical protein
MAEAPLAALCAEWTRLVSRERRRHGRELSDDRITAAYVTTCLSPEHLVTALSLACA